MVYKLRASHLTEYYDFSSDLLPHSTEKDFQICTLIIRWSLGSAEMPNYFTAALTQMSKM